MTIDSITINDFQIRVELAAKNIQNLEFYGAYLAYSGPEETVYSGYGNGTHPKPKGRVIQFSTKPFDVNGTFTPKSLFYGVSGFNKDYACASHYS